MLMTRYIFFQVLAEQHSGSPITTKGWVLFKMNMQRMLPITYGKYVGVLPIRLFIKMAYLQTRTALACLMKLHIFALNTLPPAPDRTLTIMSMSANTPPPTRPHPPAPKKSAPDRWPIGNSTKDRGTWRKIQRSTTTTGRSLGRLGS